MDRKIGEVFQHGELTLRVEEGEGCSGCVFDHRYGSHPIERDIRITGSCLAGMRRDKRDAIFKEVKK